MTVEPTYLYAALLDVLAYRYHLNKDRDRGNFEFQERLSTALKVFDSVNDAIFRVQAISDTVILTCPDHATFPSFLGLLRNVFIAFLDQGLLVRGGISYSRHFQSGHLTYSHAIARAYELESKVAVYPRIVVDDNIVRMYENGTGLPTIHGQGLLCTENGVYFLNVLTPENWGRIYEYAQKIYHSDAGSGVIDESALSKHLRFERYLLRSEFAPPDVKGFIDGIKPS